jgi:endogenous inhibitor of DNA gyrase (YacG/DUF329 family)
MIIVAGAAPRVEKHPLKTEKHCFHCNNTSRWVLQKTRHFITLFFLPVAPYKTDYLMYCPICGNTVKLSKEDYEQKVRFEAEST